MAAQQARQNTVDEIAARTKLFGLRWTPARLVSSALMMALKAPRPSRLPRAPRTECGRISLAPSSRNDNDVRRFASRKQPGRQRKHAAIERQLANEGGHFFVSCVCSIWIQSDAIRYLGGCTSRKGYGPPLPEADIALVLPSSERRDTLGSCGISHTFLTNSKTLAFPLMQFVA